MWVGGGGVGSRGFSPSMWGMNISCHKNIFYMTYAGCHNNTIYELNCALSRRHVTPGGGGKGGHFLVTG